MKLILKFLLLFFQQEGGVQPQDVSSSDPSSYTFQTNKQ